MHMNTQVLFQIRSIKKPVFGHKKLFSLQNAMKKLFEMHIFRKKFSASPKNSNPPNKNNGPSLSFKRWGEGNMSISSTISVFWEESIFLHLTRLLCSRNRLSIAVQWLIGKSIFHHSDEHCSPPNIDTSVWQ